MLLMVCLHCVAPTISEIQPIISSKFVILQCMHQLTLTSHISDCYSNLHKLSIQCRKVILAPLQYLGTYSVHVYGQRKEIYHECLCEKIWLQYLIVNFDGIA